VLQQEVLTRTVLTMAAEAAAAVKGVTLCHGKQGTLFGADQQLHICLRSQSSLAAKVMEMKLHRLRDVTSDYAY